MQILSKNTWDGSWQDFLKPQRCWQQDCLDYSATLTSLNSNSPLCMAAMHALPHLPGESRWMGSHVSAEHVKHIYQCIRETGVPWDPINPKGINQPQEWQLISKPHSAATTGVTTYFKATFNCITRIHSTQSDSIYLKAFWEPLIKPTYEWNNIFENLPVTLILFLINLFLCQLGAALFGPSNWQSSVLTLSLLSS